ncbi:MAG: twin-arginine translocase subunit TatC [Thermodesulfobacteriota bacterium]
MTDKEKKKKENYPDGEGGKMSFTAHLEELRWRLVRCFIAVGVGFGFCYYYSKPLFRIMMYPLLSAMPEGKQQLIYTGLPEAFLTYLKVGLWGGLILAMPYIFYQLWCFVAPGLYKKEKSYLVPFVFFASLLFVLGGLFGYLVVFPFGFKFFLGFSDETIQALPAIKEYFSLSMKLLFGFGLVFELPLVMVFLAKMGLVNAAKLAKGRKWAILIIFIVAAILTPPDVLSQILMAMPLLVLYEVSIILVRLMVRPREKAAAIEEGSSTG